MAVNTADCCIGKKLTANPRTALGDKTGQSRSSIRLVSIRPAPTADGLCLDCLVDWRPLLPSFCISRAWGAVADIGIDRNLWCWSPMFSCTSHCGVVLVRSWILWLRLVLPPHCQAFPCDTRRVFRDTKPRIRHPGLRDVDDPCDKSGTFPAPPQYQQRVGRLHERVTSASGS